MVVLCSIALCCHLYDIVLAYLRSFSSSSTVEWPQSSDWYFVKKWELYGIVLCFETLYGTDYCTVLCCMVLYCVGWCCITWHCSTWWCMGWHHVALCCIGVTRHCIEAHWCLLQECAVLQRVRWQMADAVSWCWLCFLLHTGHVPKHNLPGRCQHLGACQGAAQRSGRSI